jgi:NAD(P)-dependent dehydrogenase (short-subunit alcohol dehydrogenase family)
LRAHKLGQLGPFHIRCNAILLGMNARMQGIVAAKALKSGSTIAEVEAGYLKHISMRVQIEPSELADVVLFLSSDAARKITGELIAVSGNLEWEE